MDKTRGTRRVTRRGRSQATDSDPNNNNCRLTHIYKVGDEVDVVKPGRGPRQWVQGVITAKIDSNNVKRIVYNLRSKIMRIACNVPHSRLAPLHTHTLKHTELQTSDVYGGNAPVYVFHYVSNTTFKSFIVFCVVNDGIFKYDIENNNFSKIYHCNETEKEMMITQNDYVTFDKNVGKLLVFKNNAKLYNGYSSLNKCDIDNCEWTKKEITCTKIIASQKSMVIDGAFNGIYFIGNIRQRIKSTHFKYHFDGNYVTEMESSLNDMHISPKQYHILYFKMEKQLLLIHKLNIYAANINDEYLKWTKLDVKLVDVGYRMFYDIAFGHIVVIFNYDTLSIYCFDLLTKALWKSHKSFPIDFCKHGIMTNCNYFHAFSKVSVRTSKQYHLKFDLLDVIPKKLMAHYSLLNAEAVRRYLSYTRIELNGLNIPLSLNKVISMFCPILV